MRQLLTSLLLRPPIIDGVKNLFLDARLICVRLICEVDNWLLYDDVLGYVSSLPFVPHLRPVYDYGRTGNAATKLVTRKMTFFITGLHSQTYVLLFPLAFRLLLLLNFFIYRMLFLPTTSINKNANFHFWKTPHRSGHRPETLLLLGPI